MRCVVDLLKKDVLILIIVTDEDQLASVFVTTLLSPLFCYTQPAVDD
jgi:hypothetical protein